MCRFNIKNRVKGVDIFARGRKSGLISTLSAWSLVAGDAATIFMPPPFACVPACKVNEVEGEVFAVVVDLYRGNVAVPREKDERAVSLLISAPVVPVMRSIARTMLLLASRV